MNELDETVKKLKEMDWESVYEKENAQIEMVSPPFEVLIKHKSYRYTWAMNNIIKYKNKETAVLNVGSHEGCFEHFAFERGFKNITTLDVDDKTVKRIKDNVPQSVIIKGFIEDSHIKDNSYDVIVITEVLEHLVDPIVALKEMKRILKKDGMILATVPLDGKIPSKMHLHKFNLYDIIYLFQNIGDNFIVMELHKYFKTYEAKSPNLFAVIYHNSD